MNTKLSGLLNRMLPRMRDVVGIDVGASGVKAVRLRTDRGNQVTVVSASLLPRIDCSPSSGSGAPLLLPKPLQAWSAAIACSFPQAGVKLLALPADKIEGAAYAELLGVPRAPETRIGYLAFESESRTEVPVLAVGVPAASVTDLVNLLPAGRPALGSVEVSGLAALSLYLQRGTQAGQKGCDLVIDAGERITTMTLCHRERPLVIRQFPQGAAAVAEQIVKDLGVDAATAVDILHNGAFDVRASLRRVFDAFLRQLSIAIDFAERRSGQRLARLLLSGGLAANNDLGAELLAQVGLQPELLTPWRGMTLAPNAVPPLSKGQEASFAAATGAALNLLEVA